MKKLMEELKQEYENDMVGASRKVLEKFGVSSAPVPIVKIMSGLGFKVVLQSYTEENLSGIIGIDMKLKDTHGSDKIISVNKRDAIGHQRFTMAHELCHYIFDFNRDSLESYYDGYDTAKADEPSEVRANTFAANLLMPEQLFCQKYRERSDLKQYDRVLQLSEDFQVSPTAVKRRMEELKEVL